MSHVTKKPIECIRCQKHLIPIIPEVEKEGYTPFSHALVSLAKNKKGGFSIDGNMAVLDAYGCESCGYVELYSRLCG